jgi:hypothetical protein
MLLLLLLFVTHCCWDFVLVSLLLWVWVFVCRLLYVVVLLFVVCCVVVCSLMMAVVLAALLIARAFLGWDLGSNRQAKETGASATARKHNAAISR